MLAGLGSRFVARFLDSLIQGAAIIALLFGLGLLSIGSGGEEPSGWLVAVFVVLVFGVIFAYDLAFEVLGSGRTPGKRLAGIRVVGLRGQPVGFLASAVRNIVRLVDLLPGVYLVAIVTVLVSSRDQRLGDMAAGTLVVRERFGGTRGETQVAAWTAPVTVPPEAVAAWDVSAITPDEVRAARHFLDRRLSLPWHVRIHLANELVSRLWPRITGAPNSVHPEYILEGIVVAKSARG